MEKRVRLHSIGTLVIWVCFTNLITHAYPQGGGGGGGYSKPDEKYAPMPYNYEYEVNDPPSKSYFGQEETLGEDGRTDGKYFVWLPDGRLMTVTYYVEGDSGFVPRIHLSETNYSPPPPTHQLSDKTNSG